MRKHVDELTAFDMVKATYKGPPKLKVLPQAKPDYRATGPNGGRKVTFTQSTAYKRRGHDPHPLTGISSHTNGPLSDWLHTRLE